MGSHTHEYGNRRGVKLLRAMKVKITAAILVGGLAQFALADTTIQQAQAELKEQGFYFGEVNGDKNADTVTAIRRFQIRSGLQVTGELNEETVRALHAALSSSSSKTASVPKQKMDEDPGDTARQPAAPAYPQTSIPPASQIYRAQPAPSASAVSVFRNTPYELAPPLLQQEVIIAAQRLLRRRGFYTGANDGVFGQNFEFSVRAFQSRLGIQPSGRLDMDTLAALGLLPGQHGRTPMEMPRRRGAPLDEAPVRGEWIH
jgi:peptidoglycan hydrolase-like protein with peptidoglycan-binding domain